MYQNERESDRKSDRKSDSKSERESGTIVEKTQTSSTTGRQSIARRVPTDAPLNHMQQYCLEQLGMIRFNAWCRKEGGNDAFVKHCNICHRLGHVSHQCHRYLHHM